jgi:hypothetical protein
LHVVNDTVVVEAASGVLRFNRDGQFISTTPPVRARLLGPLPLSRYFLRRTTSETHSYQGQKGVEKALLNDSLHIMDARGTPGPRIAVLPSRVHVNVYNPDPNPLGLTITYLESPFEPEAKYAVARGGFYYCDGRRFEIRLHSTSGRLTRIIRLATPDLLVTSVMADTWRQTILRKYTVPETRRYIEWVLGQYQLPPAFPMVKAMVLAADGRIWLRENAFPAAASASWHVFHPDGAYQGVVRLPSAWTVHQIENEFVLVSVATPDGAALVQVHPVRG